MSTHDIQNVYQSVVPLMAFLSLVFLGFIALKCWLTSREESETDDETIQKEEGNHE